MKFIYTPKADYELFGDHVYRLLVENFPETYFVGGLVRDALLGRKIEDIDIATLATPKQTAHLLQSSGIKPNENNSKFGVVSAVQGNYVIEIATFREDVYRTNRYPKVRLVATPKDDSDRRDFTVNALYLEQKTGAVSDFHNGLSDLEKKLLRFIGQPDRRITEDPLRILRALRFALSLKFRLEKKTFLSIKNNFTLLKKISETRKKTEIEKIPDKKNKLILEKVINKPEILDKFFKTS